MKFKLNLYLSGLIIWLVINYQDFVVRTWEIRYRLEKVGGKYFFRRIEARYQHEALKIFKSEMPNAYPCGNPRPI